jgi:hypothetical protein
MPDRSHVPCAASGGLANAKTTGTTSFLNISVFQLAAQIEGRELSATRSQPEKAEDIIPIAAQLPDSEKLALLKYLVNTLEYA